MRYRADITAGSLKLPESRVIADLLLDGVDGKDWDTATQVTAGNGSLKMSGLGSNTAAKEPIKVGYDYFKANASHVSASIKPGEHDYHLHIVELQNTGPNTAMALTTFVALCSAVLGKPVQSQLVVLGTMSLGGSIVPVALLEIGSNELAEPGIQIPLDLITDCVRLCCSLCLLENDPTVIEPDVLSKDRAKFEGNGDQKYVDKAHRRGKVGWNVGRHIEVAPHYRRPHMALVWTGRGRAVPKVVPRKGSVVHREKVENVPSGFEEKEEP